jgi:diaminohydroxyphosphoribosylaminopyrimidine deaminase/5-amino-6-(5-phosphoribosylamino)uracil reductase
VLSRSGKLPSRARIFTDHFVRNTLVYGEMKLDVLLCELGAKEITSVLIEGGGDLLGQALDLQLIDKLQIYIAPIFTGGPTIAFAGNGAESTSSGARLTRVRYEKIIGGDVCVLGYPAVDRVAAE